MATFLVCINRRMRIVRSIEAAKRIAEWGTYGKHSDEPLHYKRLIDCSTDHLQNILRTQRHIRRGYYEVIIHCILQDRGCVPAVFSAEAEHELWLQIRRVSTHHPAL